MDLSYRGKITNVGVGAAGKNCHLLCDIDLCGCNQIFDLGVLVVAHGSSLLKNIDLSFCSKNTDAGVSAIANYFPCLRYEFAHGCYCISIRPICTPRVAYPCLQIYYETATHIICLGIYYEEASLYSYVKIMIKRILRL